MQFEFIKSIAREILGHEDITWKLLDPNFHPKTDFNSPNIEIKVPTNSNEDFKKFVDVLENEILPMHYKACWVIKYTQVPRG